MKKGDLVTFIKTHIGIGRTGLSYLLEPGDSGLLVKLFSYPALLVFIANEVVEVETSAVEILHEEC